MNNSPLPKVLLAILAVIAVWELLLCWNYFGKVRELRELQVQMNAVNYRQQVFSMMLQDAAEYSKRNPAMETLLRSLGPTSAPPVAPSGVKTPSK